MIHPWKKWWRVSTWHDHFLSQSSPNVGESYYIWFFSQLIVFVTFSKALRADNLDAIYISMPSVWSENINILPLPSTFLLLPLPPSPMDLDLQNVNVINTYSQFSDLNGLCVFVCLLSIGLFWTWIPINCDCVWSLWSYFHWRKSPVVWEACISCS